MSKVIQLVQFKNRYTETGGEGDDCRKGDIVYMNEEKDSHEFYMGDDDDGDSMYDEKECLSFTTDLKDAERGRYLSYVPTDEIEYTTITIELEEA